MASMASMSAWLDAFDGRAAAAWFSTRTHVPVLATLGYCAMLLLLPRLMAGRKPLKLYRVTFYWNALLTLFSCCGTAGCLPTLLRVLSTDGFQFSVRAAMPLTRGPRLLCSRPSRRRR
jgi:hypothetical protein